MLFNKSCFYKGRPKAFSIAEVAIALAIAALVSLPLISVSSGFFERAKYDKTNKSLATINEALKSYYIMNKALPCPADPSLNPSSASYASPLNCYATSGVAIGAVPVDTLGLSRDFMLDGYGRKFSYAVARRFTSTANIVKFYRNDATKLIVADDGNGNIITAGNDSGTGQQILINKSDGTKLNDDSIYAVLSYGKNGLGSFAGSVLSCPPALVVHFGIFRTVQGHDVDSILPMTLIFLCNFNEDCIPPELLQTL